MKFLSICSFGIFVFNIIRSIYSEVGTEFIDQYFIWAMIVCGVEVIIVFGWYIYKLISVKRKIKRIKDKAEEDQAKAQEKREKEQVYYQQELMKIKEQYDLTIDETKPLTEEPIIYEEIIEEVQDEPPEITPEPEVELVKEEIPEIPIIVPQEEFEPSAEELVSVEEEQPEEVLTFLDEDQPTQDEQVIDESTEQEDATEEEDLESMYDYNQTDEEDEEE
jgi:hypothetical protein